jgi:hypothetical protein
MPVKRRIPKEKIPEITDEMIELYRRGREIIAAGDHEFWEEDGGRQREYLDLTKKLDWNLLKLYPSDAGPLDIVELELDDGDPNGGSPTYRESLPRARELYELFQKEIRR